MTVIRAGSHKAMQTGRFATSSPGAGAFLSESCAILRSYSTAEHRFTRFRCRKRRHGGFPAVGATNIVARPIAALGVKQLEKRSASPLSGRTRLLAQVADGDDRTSHAAAAVKHLAEASNRGYFDVPGKVTELFQADFTGLRDHADFAKLKKDIEDDAGVLVLSKQGALRADDPRDPVLKKSPHHVFEVKMTAGKRYAIHLARTGQEASIPSCGWRIPPARSWPATTIPGGTRTPSWCSCPRRQVLIAS